MRIAKRRWVVCFWVAAVPRRREYSRVIVRARCRASALATAVRLYPETAATSNMTAWRYLGGDG